MALGVGEAWSGGFVRDGDGNLLVTDDDTGAIAWGGFLRDPDGRLVVTDDDTGATDQGGFLRAPATLGVGAVVVTEDDTGAASIGGWQRAAASGDGLGALVISEGGGSETGSGRTDSGAIAVSGFTTVPLGELDAGTPDLDADTPILHAGGYEL